MTSSHRDALKLWIALARAARAVEVHATADAARHGCTLAEFGVLEALHHKGPQLLGELQRRLLVSSGGITYLVDRLEQRGLLRREPCPDDRRARVAALTADGTALVARAFPEHAAVIAEALAGLSRTEQRHAVRLVRKLGLHVAGLRQGGSDGDRVRTPTAQARAQHGRTA